MNSAYKKSVARRLLAIDYSPRSQSEWVDSRGDSWRHSYLAQLRCDLITSERIVLPDTHLLDGQFFMLFKPEELAAELGLETNTGRRGIELRLRQPTIRDTLASWLVRADKPTLNEFEFKLFRNPELRTHVSKTVGNTSVHDWHGLMKSADGDPARALSELLKSSVKSAPYDAVILTKGLSEIDAAERSWSYWQEKGAETFFTGTWVGRFDLLGALEADPLSKDITTEVAYKLYRMIVTIVREGGTRVSDIRSLITKAVANAHDTEERSQVNNIDRWYSRGRNRAIALQHECSFAFDAGEAATGQEIGTGRLAFEGEPPQGTLVQFPHVFLERIASTSGPDLANALRPAAIHLDMWWNRGDFGALSRAVEIVTDNLKMQSAWELPPYVQRYVRVSAPVVGAAAAMLTGEIAPAAILGGLVLLGGEGSEHFRKARFRRRVVEALAARA
jgi:hypothetical protein